jgi:hypothetical protein
MRNRRGRGRSPTGGPASSGVPEDEQVLRLAAGDDQVGLAVAVEVGGFEVLDRDLLGGDHAGAPGLAGVVERREETDARFGAAPADHDLVGARAEEVGAGDRVAFLKPVEDLVALPSASRVARVDGRFRAMERFHRRDERP